MEEAIVKARLLAEIQRLENEVTYLMTDIDSHIADMERHVRHSSGKEQNQATQSETTCDNQQKPTAMSTPNCQNDGDMELRLSGTYPRQVSSGGPQAMENCPIRSGSVGGNSYIGSYHEIEGIQHARNHNRLLSPQGTHNTDTWIREPMETSQMDFIGTNPIGTLPLGYSKFAPAPDYIHNANTLKGVEQQVTTRPLTYTQASTQTRTEDAAFRAVNGDQAIWSSSSQTPWFRQDSNPTCMPWLNDRTTNTNQHPGGIGFINADPVPVQQQRLPYPQPTWTTEPSLTQHSLQKAGSFHDNMPITDLNSGTGYSMHPHKVNQVQGQMQGQGQIQEPAFSTGHYPLYERPVVRDDGIDGSQPKPEAQRTGFKRKEKEPAHFDGKSVDFQDYIVHFEQVSEWNKWGNEEKAKQLVMSLRGTTQKLLSDLSPEQLHDYAKVRQALTQRFNPPGRAMAYRCEFRNRKREKGESVIDYGYAIRRIGCLAFPDVPQSASESYMVDQFVYGAGDHEMKKHIQFKHVATLDEAITAAVEFEACDGSRSQVRKPLPETEHPSQQIAAIKTEDKDNVTEQLSVLTKSVQDLAKAVEKIQGKSQDEPRWNRGDNNRGNGNYRNGGTNRGNWSYNNRRPNNPNSNNYRASPPDQTTNQRPANADSTGQTHEQNVHKEHSSSRSPTHWMKQSSHQEN